jgi:PAS domain S-box-containing protein
MASKTPADDLLRILSEVADDYAVFAMDPDGRVVRWPPEAQRLKGFDPEEILGEHISIFYEPTDVEAGRPERALVAASREGRYDEEGWRRRKDGSRFWASVIVTPLRDAEDRLVGYAKVTRDLTRQRQAEDALRSVARRLEGIIELSVDGIISVDEDLRVIGFNRGAEKTFGFARNQILGQTLDRLIPPRFRERHAQRIREFGEAEEASRRMGHRGEIVGLRKNGDEFPAEASISKQTVDGRRVFTVVLRDVTVDREAETTLRDLEARWHRMADALPILFSYIDREQRFRFVNQEYESWFGIPRGEIVGKSVRELLGDQTYASVEPHIREAFEGRMVRYEADLRTPGVQPRSTEIFLQPEQTGDGRVVGCYVVGVDVSDRRRFERILRGKEAAIRALYQIGSHPSLDLDEKIRALLELGCQQLHLDLGVLARVVDGRWEVRQTHPDIDGIRPGDTYPLNRTLCSETLRVPEPRGIVYGAESDGDRYPAYPGRRVGAYLGARVTVAGEVYGTLSFSNLRGRSAPFTQADRDLIRLMSLWIGNELHRRQVLGTQTMLAEAGRVLASSLKDDEVLASIARLAVPTLGDGCTLYASEEEGVVRRVQGAHADAELNVVIQESIGSTLGAASDRPVLDVIRGGKPLLLPWTGAEGTDAASLADPGFNGLPPDQVQSIMVVPLTARGRVLGAMALVSAKPHRYAQRELAAAQELALRGAMALDNANLYRRARDAIRMRDEVLSFVTHDLGSPLSSIAMVVDRLLDVPVAEDRRGRTRSYLEGVRDSATRMERLIHDLLEVRLLEEGRLAVRRRKLSVGVLLETVEREFRPRCEDKSLTLDLAPVAQGEVRGDRDRLLQVLSNLMDNAIKFTDAGGCIRLGVEALDGDVLFSVSDTGEGIEPERLADLFDRYTQARRSKRAGAGLGLAITKEIVEAHEGAVWAESTAGAGSTFYFTLPRA